MVALTLVANHHGNRAAFMYDRHCDYELTLSGYTVLRLANDEIALRRPELQIAFFMRRNGYIIRRRQREPQNLPHTRALSAGQTHVSRASWALRTLRRRVFRRAARDSSSRKPSEPIVAAFPETHVAKPNRP